MEIARKSPDRRSAGHRAAAPASGRPARTARSALRPSPRVSSAGPKSRNTGAVIRSSTSNPASSAGRATHRPAVASAGPDRSVPGPHPTSSTVCRAHVQQP
ncbi:hypothetical protein J7S33_14180 [Saccharothrix algeriensis]|uniref:Uncharacterized protein n=1 Tax=Saccharothrix algeriensis TaxID=173560 RepID=A0A8T8I4E6_9PSEU|nr:hypothetical protein [Saccharothrix algeriensis]QTR05609.1 hypothetical protein J7S33_14180 [Saccharothrix algeriensis]